MKFAVRIALVTAILLSPAVAAEKASPGNKLSVRDALSLLLALRNLDGRAVVIDQGGQKTTVVQPWEFKSGVVRLRIATNLAALSNVERAADEARIGIVKQVRKKFNTEKIEGDPAAFEEFSRLYDDVLKSPAATGELARIKASDLKLDVNEISVTVLQALTPILEQDVK